jgi:hypothetical protein
MSTTTPPPNNQTNEKQESPPSSPPTPSPDSQPKPDPNPQSPPTIPQPTTSIVSDVFQSARKWIADTFTVHFPMEVHLIIAGLFKVVLGVFAWILSWNCNQMVPMVGRVLISLISAIFSEIYIIYYSVWYTMMGNKCF